MAILGGAQGDGLPMVAMHGRVVVIDHNGDSAPDLLFAPSNSSYPNRPTETRLWGNDGEGLFVDVGLARLGQLLGCGGDVKS